MTDNASTELDAARWDQYWAHGFLTSCADAFDGNYEGVLRAVWEQFFAELPAGARLLDLCTGNGAIAAIAADRVLAGKAQFAIHASDLAAIRPELALRDRPELLQLIRFHPRTAAELLPFANASFDCICGQFAYEYTDQTRSARELARVLRPDGKLLFLMHHGASVILKTAREELGHAALILDSTGIFDLAAALLNNMAQATTPAARRELSADPDAEQVRQGLNAAAARLTNAARNSPHPELLQVALTYLGQAFDRLGREGLPDALSRLKTGRIEVAANAERLQDLNRAATGPDSIAQVLGILRAAGLGTADAVPFSDGEGRLVAWKVTAQRT